MRHGAFALGLLLISTSYIIGNAFYQKKQFYPTVVYLTKHKLFFAVIVIQCLTFICLFAMAICWIFFGNLQRDELDHLLSRSWYTFFDMCLVFAFFQDELNAKYMFLFAFILLMKVFHWLLEERIDHMERTPVITLSFHIRMFLFVTFLGCVDIAHIAYFYWGTTSEFLASLAVGAEYYILLFGLISTVMRYILQIINSMHDTPWDQKALYLLYVDIFIGLLRLAFYMEFAPILWSHHPFPLFIIRPIYLNFRFLKKTIRDLLMSRRAIRMMNTEFSDVTTADLSASSDTVCIICREEMLIPQPPASQGTTPQVAPRLSQGTVKRLPCSHIFHAACLRTWFQRQQTCPTCRANVFNRIVRRQAAAAAGPERLAAAGGLLAGIAADQQHLNHHNNVRRHETTGNAANQPQVPPAGVSPFLPNAFPFMHANMPIPPMIPGANLSMMQPPILIPGNAFMPGPNLPMPVPPDDLTNPPTAEEEALLRTNIGVRVQTLRQIQTLLDAAIIQMNAYIVATTAPESNTATKIMAVGKVSTSSSDSFSKLPSSQDDSINSEEVDTSVTTAQGENENDGDLASLRRRRLEKLDHKES